MRFCKTITINITYILIILLVLTTTFAFTSTTLEGTFLNTQRGTSQTISQAGDETAFLNVKVIFAQTNNLYAYKLIESETAPQDVENLEKVYRYLSLEIEGGSQTVQNLETTFRVEKSNRFKIEPDTLHFYGHTTETGWVKIPHTVSYTTDSHYVFAGNSIHYDTLAITATDISPELAQENQTNGIAEKEKVDIIEAKATTTQSGNTETVKYIDDEKERSTVLIIIIVIVILGLIGGTIYYVNKKHKEEPSNVKSLENLALEMRIQELIQSGKSNGEIVDLLTDQEYSIDSIMDHLRKLGRL